MKEGARAGGTGWGARVGERRDRGDGVAAGEEEVEGVVAHATTHVRTHARPQDLVCIVVIGCGFLILVAQRITRAPASLYL